MKHAHCQAYLTIFICGLVGIANTKNSSLNHDEQPRSNCGSGNFRCLNGECITNDSLCNGRPDCSDRSDETREGCTSTVCPEFDFRCDYGACINGSALCNGIQDCADNSDELLARCSNNSASNDSINVCGRIFPEDPLILNGEEANTMKFPWHANLYKSEIPGGEKRFVCGATIIRSDLLITAAHCIYNEPLQRIDDTKKFSIVTGNIHRDYNSVHHNLNIVKKYNVKRIYVNFNYLGLVGNYAGDIAIIQIERPFKFSSLLMPACLDSSANNEESVFHAGNYGKISGFGRTTMSNESQILQTLSVPYRTFDECRSTLNPETRRFITIDKFCGGLANGTSVCTVYSGSGIFFKNNDKKWYVRGILSLGLGSIFVDNTSSCNGRTSVLYTKISSHIAWIQDIVRESSR